MLSSFDFPPYHHASTPVHRRPNIAQAASVQALVAQRNIKSLVHLTPIENFIHICAAKNIWSVQQLKARKIPYSPFDVNRLDGYLNHINCSISYYNFQMFYGRVYKSQQPVVILHIRPDYLWKQGTKFCPVNAAMNRGRFVGQGFDCLQQLFNPTVKDRQGIQTRDGKPECLPTSIQAEVLISTGIPLTDITRVLVRNSIDKQRVCRAGWRGEIAIAPDHFKYHSEWINKSEL